MSEIRFTPEQKAQLVERLRDYLAAEHEIELERFPAEFLLDFVTETFGPLWYNRGLLDARTLFESRVESVGEAIVELERPTPFVR